MLQSLINGASGMAAHQKNVDIIANNIANINTVGFIKERAEFKDALYTTMLNPHNPNSLENLQQGNGVLVNGISKVYANSTNYETANPLDVAIDNEGFFAVLGADDQIYYTKDGSFKAVPIEDELYLATANGNFVLNEDLEPILLYGNINEISIDNEGYITFSQDDEPTDKIAVFNFININGLRNVGGNLLAETQNSGAAQLLEVPCIKQRFLTGSNVNLTDEMTQLIRAQRAYQLASKVVTTADEMQALANNLRS